MSNCSGSNPCPPSNDDGQIKFYRDTLRVYKGSSSIAHFSLCDFLINYKNYCNQKITITKGEEILIDNCGLGYTANMIFIKTTEIKEENTRPFYLDKYKLNLVNNGEIKIQWRNLDCIEWQPIYNLMILTGTQNNPIKPIIIKNLSPFNVQLDVLISNPSLDMPKYDNTCLVDNETLMIDNLYYNDIISINPHTLHVIQSSELKTTIAIDNILSINKDGNLIHLHMANNKKIYLLLVSSTETIQLWSSLRYLIENKEDHLSSSTNSFSLPMPYDNESPKIYYNQKNIYLVDNKLNTKMFLDSFEKINGAKIITKNNLIDFLILSISDNRDGIIYKDPSILKIFKENDEINEINSKGMFLLKIKVKDLAENIKEEEIKIEIK